MQLLITGMNGDTNHSGFEKLDTYKYRNDVHLYASLDDAAFYQTTASAYALILPGVPGSWYRHAQYIAGAGAGDHAQ